MFHVNLGEYSGMHSMPVAVQVPPAVAAQTSDLDRVLSRRNLLRCVPKPSLMRLGNNDSPIFGLLEIVSCQYLALQ